MVGEFLGILGLAREQDR